MAIPSYIRARTISPGDNHEQLLAGLTPYIDQDKFEQETSIGGRYNWEGPDNYPYAGVAVSGSTMSQANLEIVDSIVDDGNLGTGHYRVPANGRFTYIIEE